LTWIIAQQDAISEAGAMDFKSEKKIIILYDFDKHRLYSVAIPEGNNSQRLLEF